MGFVRRLYDWMLSWAEHPAGVWALFVLAFMESSFFPIPPDVLLIALAIGNPSRSLWFASVCTIGSVIGALVGYGIGWGVWEAVDQYFFAYVPGFTPELFKKVCEQYELYSFWIVFTAAFTPIPYKVITISAGVSQISLLPFIVASIIGRGARFYLVAGLIWKFGAPIKEFIDKYLNLLTILLTILGIGGFIALKFLF
ncbi:MAG TPA: YqaA family protein [Candidatus Ozemobacteraceae bacterium]|nr:YqaA family protein [Candidatus Ozemobacteraceae bacterium]